MRDPMTPAEEARFFAKVELVQSGCWEWTGTRSKGGYYLRGESPGYGMFWFRGEKRNAHAVAYQSFIAPAPRRESGLCIDHLCRNHGCVNPAHLEVVTQRENKVRGQSVVSENARKTHCKRGHEFTEANTYLYRGTRACRTCRALYKREVRKRTS